ncbi:MAG: hypothetical protein SWK76_04870 [Actinomycetota bacterium]|nr:hypothetical protein [Actinomycetota bacterium]
MKIKRYFKVFVVFVAAVCVLFSLAVLLSCSEGATDSVQAADEPDGIKESGGEAETADRNVSDWTLMGLDARNYANNMAVKVSDAEKDWVHHHKMVLKWNKIEPSQDAFNWSFYDNQINARLADGCQSILILLQGEVPAWARDPSYGDLADIAPPLDWGDWYDFCAAVAERYGSVVDFYEIWNEPGWDRDSYAFEKFGLCHFGGQVETDYLPMLQLGYAAVKEQDPSGQVICGALINSMDQEPATRGTELTAQLFDEVNRPGQDVSVEIKADKDIVAERPMYFNYCGAWTGGHDVLGANQSAGEWYFAEGTTRDGFDEWICLQNPGDAAIHVDAVYMFGPGQGANDLRGYDLPPESRTTIKVNSEVGTGKDVSVRLTSSGDFIAERPMYFNYNGVWTGGHDVVGANQSAGEWYFAEGTTRDGFDEYLCLQNPGDAAIHVDAVYMFGPGQGANDLRGYDLPPKSRTTLNVNSEVGADKDVSVRLTSSGDFIAERPMYFNYNGVWTGGHDVVGANQSAGEWYFAEGTTRDGFDEYLCLQNPGDAAIHVDAVYMFGPGQGANDLRGYDLPPKSRTTIKVNTEVGEEKDVSVRLTSSGDFIAERPMYFNYNGVWTGGHDVLGARGQDVLEASGVSDTWYFAEGCTGFSIQEYLCLQNPHDEPVNVDLTFMMIKGEVFQRSVELEPKSRTTLNLNMLIGFHGSCDMVAAHPYKMPNNWGAYYSALVDVLRSRGAGQEVVATEIGWPNYADGCPECYDQQQQADALSSWGMATLVGAGCRKIWVYRAIDEDPGKSWDGNYYGLFSYQGVPHLAWDKYKQWQQGNPTYPNLPTSLP